VYKRQVEDSESTEEIKGANDVQNLLTSSRQ